MNLWTFAIAFTIATLRLRLRLVQSLQAEGRVSADTDAATRF